MKRVVVTGMGIVSSIGNNTQEVLASLREAKSGIVRADRYAELGFRCQVHGAPTLEASETIDRRAMRFLGGGAAWNHVAMEQAIRDAGLDETEVSNERTGIIMGSGGPSTRTIVESADITRSKGPKRVGPFAVPKAMSSTASLGSSVGAPCTWQRKPSSAYLSARTMPDLASRNDASTSCVLLPMDETMPIPVMTTRFIFTSSEMLRSRAPLTPGSAPAPHRGTARL